MKQKTGDNYRGKFRKEMRGGYGKNRASQYEGIFAELNWNAIKGSRKIPKFSFFQADEGTCRTGICKLCMTRVKVFYTHKGNEPFLVSTEDNKLHKKWIGNRGWHCIVPKSDKPKEESETMKRLKNKRIKAENTEDCFYVEPE